MKMFATISLMCLFLYSCSGENKAPDKQGAKEQKNDEVVLRYRDWMAFSEKLLNGVEVRLSDVRPIVGSPIMTYVNHDGQCILIYKYLSSDETTIKECVVVLKDPQIEKIGYGLNRGKPDE
jgi:hypothetical protein